MLKCTVPPWVTVFTCEHCDTTGLLQVSGYLHTPGILHKYKYTQEVTYDTLQ